MTGPVSNSQDFTLRLSDSSTDEDIIDLSEAKNKTDVIVISDSSSSSSSYVRKSKDFPINTSTTKKKSFLKEKNENNTTVQLDKSYSFYTSDETDSSSGNIKRDQKNLRNQINKSATKLPFAEQKLTPRRMREKYYNEKVNDVNDIIQAQSNILRELSKSLFYNTSQQDDTIQKLIKQDDRKILQNIKSKRLVCNSPRQKKETDVIIDETINTDEEETYPAISTKNNRKFISPDSSPGVIHTSVNEIIPDSQPDLSQSNIDSRLRMSKQLDLDFKPLSERKKKQIAEWLMTNLADSRSDSSFSHVPPSTRNSIGSGNGSLERFELNNETPNNRGKIQKVQTDEKQSVVVNSEKKLYSPQHQTILDRHVIQKSTINSELHTPDRSKDLSKAYTEKKEIHSVEINISKDTRITDCADILDKLYGASWRDKANVLLPATEPRKVSLRTNTAVQTKRKYFSTRRLKELTKKNYIRDDSDSDKSISSKEDIKSNRRKQIQRKYKKQDSFINDESLSSDTESMYHTALTNPRTSTNNAAPKPASTVVKRVYICDTDTEDDERSVFNDKNLRGRRLSFSDDESSRTSEFDPEDFVLPKSTSKKNIPKTPLSKAKVKSDFSTEKCKKYKSFLASLSSTVPMHDAHPDAKIYRLNYINNKEELCKTLYKLYNEKVFDNKLPSDMLIEWNARMRGTAGFCYNKRVVKSISGVTKSSRIVLATKILDEPDRLRDTLIHEMCHAAAWLINDISDGHGPCWMAWATKAMKLLPELPPILRCHDYKIKTKFTYKCTSCGYSIGRHSKSLDTEKNRCGYCFGKFELLINKTTKTGTVQKQMPKKEPSGFALYVKQNYNSVKKEKNNMKHGDVMKILGQRFSTIKIASKNHVIVQNDSEVSKNSETDR